MSVDQGDGSAFYKYPDIDKKQTIPNDLVDIKTLSKEVKEMSAKNYNYVRFVKSDGHDIPIVDLTHLDGDEEKRKLLSEELGDIVSTIGFFYVENHGIDTEFLELTKNNIFKFFQMSEEDKNQIHISKSPYHRGYFPNKEENALGSDIYDVKEGFDMALELPADDPSVVAGKPFHGPNAWPKSFPDFRPNMLDLYESWRSLAGRLSRLFSMNLGLEEDFFVKRTQKPLCQLRVAKYPQQNTVDVEGSIGCGVHTDYSVLSIIWQVDAPGLQLQTLDGEWVTAPKIDGTFVCPIGDTTDMYTNGLWRATPHRVINVSPVQRHSSAFFYDLDYDCEIEPLPQFVTAERPPKFKKTTMGEHVTRGFNGTFAYRKSDNESESDEVVA
jgi:isopenicillin N synthase-like dioxygenase